MGWRVGEKYGWNGEGLEREEAGIGGGEEGGGGTGRESEGKGEARLDRGGVCDGSGP